MKAQQRCSFVSEGCAGVWVHMEDVGETPYNSRLRQSGAFQAMWQMLAQTIAMVQHNAFSMLRWTASLRWQLKYLIWLLNWSQVSLFLLRPHLSLALLMDLSRYRALLKCCCMTACSNLGFNALLKSKLSHDTLSRAVWCITTVPLIHAWYK